MRGGTFDRVSRLLYDGAAVALIVIVLAMIGRIASRNFSLGVSGLQLYAQLFAVWLTFLVAGSLAWERRHIEIDYFTQKLPERYEPIHEMGVSTLNIFSALVILAGSVMAIQAFWDSTSPSVDIPIPLYYAAPLVGFGFLVVIWSYRIYFDAMVLTGRASPDEMMRASSTDARTGMQTADETEHEEDKSAGDEEESAAEEGGSAGDEERSTDGGGETG